jgi:hypothetical protein
VLQINDSRVDFYGSILVDVGRVKSARRFAVYEAKLISPHNFWLWTDNIWFIINFSSISWRWEGAPGGTVGW